MASQFLDKADQHWDPTCCTLEDEFGEIAGVANVTYSAGTRSRGRVLAIGSRFPVGDTPGGMTPGEGRITMNRRDAVAWWRQMKDAYAPSRVGDVKKTFKAVWAPLDEEASQLAAEVDSFDAKIDPPEGLGADRAQESTPSMVEFKLFILGPIKFGGSRVE